MALVQWRCGAFYFQEFAVSVLISICTNLLLGRPDSRSRNPPLSLDVVDTGFFQAMILPPLGDISESLDDL